MLRILSLLILGIFLLVAALKAWQSSYQATMQELHIKADRQLLQITEQFNSQLLPARILPTLLARNPELVDGLQKGGIADSVIQTLERARGLSGAHEIRLLNANGQPIYSTSDQTHINNENQTDHFKMAMQGALGTGIRLDTATEVRTFTFARSVLSDQRQIGVVVLEMAIHPLESLYGARPETLMFVDKAGTVIFSNREYLVFSSLDPYVSPASAPTTANLHITTQKHITVSENNMENYTTWIGFNNKSKTPELVNKRLIFPMGYEAILVTDITSARVQARKVTHLVLALCVLGIVSMIALLQRRNRLIERLQAEQALSKELDRRVASRSSELEQAQQQLLQSEKLSALGKMSAGISHELNQPIASIQNFTVNAKRLIEKNRIGESLENLDDIETQTVRMSRIIRNLRNFARKDNVISAPLDINAVIHQVADLLNQRIQKEHVYLHLENTTQPVMVMGGEIRLQQVLFNLLTNAIDAISSQQLKTIKVETVALETTVEVSILDNGPGIELPNRVFEPFYTTKISTPEKGLGLGLSIAYGFVESFGGSLTATNDASGGALFTLVLPTVQTGVNTR